MRVCEIIVNLYLSIRKLLSIQFDEAEMYNIYWKPTLQTENTTFSCVYIVINENILVIVNVKISYICQIKMFIETTFCH